MRRGKAIFISDTASFGATGAQRYIGPYVVAQALQNYGYDTTVFDYTQSNAGFWSAFENSLTSDTVIVGLSTTFMTPAYTWAEAQDENYMASNFERYSELPLTHRAESELVEWLGKLKRIMGAKAPRAKLIVGGAKAQFLLNYSPSVLSAVDYFFWGPAESVILSIADLLNAGETPATVEINGHKIVDTVTKHEIKRDCPEFRWSYRWNVQVGEALPIEISRGCIFNCKYCHYEKNQSLRKNIDSLRAELIYNYENFGTTFYHFCDDCFNDNRGKVESVCNMILELPFKIEWVSYARVDVAIRFPATLELMIKSGAKGLHWGIETLTGPVALSAGKGTPPEKVKAFLLDAMKTYGDECLMLGSFITGLPGETRKSQIDCMDWIVGNDALHFITVGPLKLLPFREAFDGTIMDFADYSRNPTKYGFSEISFEPAYWKHTTMDLPEARELSGLFNHKWRESRSERSGPMKTVWNYPHLRGLGFSPEDVRRFYFNDPKARELYDTATKRFRARLDSYYKNLEQDFRESDQLARPVNS